MRTGPMKWWSVRSSVCPVVQTQKRRAEGVCCWAPRRQKISIDGRRQSPAATALQHSGICGQCHAVSRRTMRDTDLLYCTLPWCSGKVRHKEPCGFMVFRKWMSRFRDQNLNWVNDSWLSPGLTMRVVFLQNSWTKIFCRCKKKQTRWEYACK